MSEKFAKLKLKRKKPTDYKSGQNVGCCVEESKRAKEGASLFQCTAQQANSSAESWWSCSDLSEVERLWLSTLKAATPGLEQGMWEPVCDLPVGSPLRPSVRDDIGWRWCSLSEEVSPFPSVAKQPAAPFAAMDVQSSEDLAGSGPGSIEGSALTGLKQRHNLFPRTGNLSWQGEGAAPCDVGGQRLHLGNEKEQQRRPQETTSSLETTAGGSTSADGPHPQVEPAGALLVAAASKQAADQGSAVGSMGDDGSPRGGDSLECCPMCLMKFPAGFTQMDCDSHLAKCLSEMNEDITW
ncbi:Fanconi anemia core complex-associated protein 20 [Arapaima gigas]